MLSAGQSAKKDDGGANETETGLHDGQGRGIDQMIDVGHRDFGAFQGG